MKSISRAGALAAVLMVTAAGTAKAQWAWEGCSGGLFNTCASVTMSVVGTQIVMTVDNYGSYNPATDSEAANAATSVFATIGLKNVGTNITLASLQSFTCASAGGSITDPTCNWAYGSTNPLNGLPDAPFSGASATAPGPTNGLNPGSGGTFYRVVLTFNTDGGTPNLDGAIFAVHGISGAEGCSTKFQVAKSGSTYTAEGPGSDEIDPNCVTITTPEPATMGLLAFGLVGLGGASLLRRRKV